MTGDGASERIRAGLCGLEFQRALLPGFDGGVHGSLHARHVVRSAVFLHDFDYSIGTDDVVQHCAVVFQHQLDRLTDIGRDVRRLKLKFRHVQGYRLRGGRIRRSAAAGRQCESHNQRREQQAQSETKPDALLGK